MKPWRQTTTDRLKGSLGGILKIGQTVPEYESNFVYIVCLQMSKTLETSAPHALPQSAKAFGYLKAIEVDSTYKDALALAKKKEKEAGADAKLKAETWDKFRLSASLVLTDHVEKYSKIKFNRDRKEVVKLFTQNADLPLTSENSDTLIASSIALHGLMEVQENAKQELN